MAVVMWDNDKAIRRDKTKKQSVFFIEGMTVSQFELVVFEGGTEVVTISGRTVQRLIAAVIQGASHNHLLALKTAISNKLKEPY